MDDSSSDRPVWDGHLAERLIGAIVVIGITRRSAADEPDSLEQMHGEVLVADPARGICIRLQGAREGEDYWLPPEPGAFHPAPPGAYRLRSTGEEIVDPDFITTWTIDPPQQ